MFRFVLYSTLVLLMSPAFADDFPANDYSPEVVFIDPEQPVEGTPRVVIDAPDMVHVGDMIVIDLSASIGTGFDLRIIPSPPTVRVFNEGRIITAATGDAPTEYLFIFSCALGDKSDIQTKVIRVETKEPPTPPAPPEPPVEPPVKPTSLASKVIGWCSDVKSPSAKSDAIKLQQVFNTLATSIRSGAFSDVVQIMDATKEANDRALGVNKDHWRPFLTHLSGELGALFDAGRLPTIESHAEVWTEVANGLQQFANEEVQ